MFGWRAIGQASPHGNYRGPFAPIIASILGVIFWLVFIVIYTLDWSGRYGLFQNVVVAISSLLIVGLLIGLMWVVWGFRRGWRRVGMDWGVDA
jgi:VIT1/CCC1 family predicted Fe2+/Mn2+ transporter